LYLAGLTTLGLAAGAYADDYITLASTTSTENSGLFNVIRRSFKAATNIQVRVVAVGTGQGFRDRPPR